MSHHHFWRRPPHRQCLNCFFCVRIISLRTKKKKNHFHFKSRTPFCLVSNSKILVLWFSFSFFLGLLDEAVSEPISMELGAPETPTSPCPLNTSCPEPYKRHFSSQHQRLPRQLKSRRGGNGKYSLLVSCPPSIPSVFHGNVALFALWISKRVLLGHWCRSYIRQFYSVISCWVRDDATLSTLSRFCTH